MKRLKDAAIILSILLLMPTTACQSKGISNRDGNIWQYSLEEAQKQEGYFIRVPIDGGYVYEPLLNPSDAGTFSSTKSSDTTYRFILMCGKDKLIPVLTGDNLMVYIDDDTQIPESFTLEKYVDSGYTFGGRFTSSDKENGLRVSSSFVSGSSMKSAWSGKSNLSLYILDNIGGYQIGAKNIDHNGVFQGLEAGKKYEFACFVGTKYDKVTVMCDTHYYQSEGNIFYIYQKDCITLTTNGFAIMTLPKELDSGYYLLNNKYMFYYDAEHMTQTPLTEQYEFADTTVTTAAAETTKETINPAIIGEDVDYDLPGDSDDQPQATE